ncbi:IS110 family transposase [Mycobacterium tuberculosis]|uniref:IS110 family transposase n=1 Tax=Mycobacterium tuberculosis TaxID=1773 RepID=UPI00045A04C4|nr:IS110 family transposase [Mycobacterium tuberculosis]KAY63885.1 transposase [Mycobacterium tuberculosis M1304]
MVVVGTDAHKYSHTFVATDEVGRQLGEKTVKATTAGHATAIMWAREQFGLELIWGIEDCRNMSARLERDLLAAGQQVVRVPTKLMAQTRKSARSRGKSDPIDALAVARAVLRETDLPLATHDETSRELKLLTDRRDVLVAQRTSAINRLRWLVHELDPERAPAARSLDAAKHQQALRTWLDTQPGLVAELARAELTDIIRLTGEINTLAQRISARVHQVAPALLEIPGCAELTAAKIVGEAAGVTRFKSEAAFACHAAVAPIPVWSGNTAGQMRLSRSGNRQLNAALHRIALTQIRMTDSRGQAYYQRLQDAGKTKRAALRCLKRRLARTVFQALRTVHQPSSEHTQPAAACHRSYCSSHLGEPPRLTDMTQKTRIQPLPPKRAGLLIRVLYRIAKRRFGEVPEPFTVTAHHRRLLIANVVHEALLQRASRKLPPSVRELAVFWTARSIGCSWCVDFGAMLQRLDGLDVDRLTDIDNYATSSKFSDDERAAIAYAEAMTADPHSVTDEQVADLRARFGEAGVIELTYQIGVENMRARMNSALGITEQGFNSGDACRVPWAAPDVPSAESR